MGMGKGKSKEKGKEIDLGQGGEGDIYYAQRQISVYLQKEKNKCCLLKN